jgi:hypothetical protein
LRSSQKSPLILALLWTIPYVGWVGFSHDVDLARYTFPLVAMVVLVVGISLPKSKVAGVSVLVGVVGAVAVVSVPLALEHQTSLPTEQLIVNYMQTNWQPRNTALIVTEDATRFIAYIKETLPNYRTFQYKWEDLPYQTWNLETQGRSVYAIFDPAKASPEWVAVARICRGRYMESRAPADIWIFRHNANYKPGNQNQVQTVPNLECNKL